MTNVLEKNIAGRNMKVEFGRVGMLSNAAIFMSYGDTVILTNVNASEKPRDGIDFFPLSVEYEERLYAVGKIPGGFIKREGRPSENAILFGRAVDRPLRPLFPKGYRNDVQVVCTVVSVEQDNLPEILAINAASMALCLSSIPFTTPVAAVQVGLIDGNYVLNPTSKEREESILQLTVCATKDRVMMIEAGGDEIPEDVMIGAIEYGFEKCQEIVAFQEEAMAKFGKKKDEPVLYKPSEELAKDIQEFAGEMIKEAMWITDKDERNAAMDVVNDKIAEEFTEKYPDNLADIKEPFLKLAMCDFSGKGTSAIEPFFRKEFSDKIKIVTSGNEWIDFVAPDINKGTALEKLVHYLGFDMSEGIAFGDQFNDIEMLQMAGDSYALSGCAPGVEAYANHMTDSVQEVLKKVLAEL